MGILIFFCHGAPPCVPPSPQKSLVPIRHPFPQILPWYKLCTLLYVYAFRFYIILFLELLFIFKMPESLIGPETHDIMINEKNSTLRWCNGPGFCLSTVKFCSKSNFPWTKFNPSPFIQRESLARVSYICGGKSMHTFRCDVKMDVLRSTDVAR